MHVFKMFITAVIFLIKLFVVIVKDFRLDLPSVDKIAYISEKSLEFVTD